MTASWPYPAVKKVSRFCAFIKRHQVRQMWPNDAFKCSCSSGSPP